MDALDCCLFGARGPAPQRNPPAQAIPSMFLTSLSLNPIPGFSQPSGLARITVNKSGWGLQPNLGCLCPHASQGYAPSSRV